jgi:hypothetical protein
MKCILLSITLLALTSAKAQQTLPVNHIQASIGASTFYKRSSLEGISVNTEYVYYFRKKTALITGLGGSFHDATIPAFYKDPVSGETKDGSLRQTVGGVQLSAQLGQSFIRTGKHELQGRLGAALRYQSSSKLRRYQIIFLPRPDYTITNYPQQRTVAFGGNLELAYNYTINNSITLGILGGIQQHTNAEQITRLCFTIGKRF